MSPSFFDQLTGFLDQRQLLVVTRFQNDLYQTRSQLAHHAGDNWLGPECNHPHLPADRDSDQNLVQVRVQEQIQASQTGNYNALVMLGHSSKRVRRPASQLPLNDLIQILELTHPHTIYTHNPADRHPTHVGAFQLALESIRHLNANEQPTQFYGAEFWGSLDWVDPHQRISFDCSQDQDLQDKLLRVFSSQNAAKDYPQGLLGRRKANATLLNSHQADQHEAVVYALDLLPLLDNPDLQPGTYLAPLLDEFKSSVISRLKKEERKD